LLLTVIRLSRSVLSILSGAVFLKLFELICICGTDKLPIHIKDLTLWIHQELSIISFDLNPSHDHIVFHIHAHLFSLGVGVGRALGLHSSWLDSVVILLAVGVGVHLFNFSVLTFQVLTVRILILFDVYFVVDVVDW
jgi:hypothetical protein